MGNCIVLENKAIKIVRNDGKVLEYREPMKVHQILTQFSGHKLFDAISNTQHLNPEAKLVHGRLYYLVPVPMGKKKMAKKVSFANPEVKHQEEEAEEEEKERLREDDDHNKENDDKNVKVVRVKIVVTKQELQKLLEGGSVHEMVNQALGKQDSLVSNDLDECCNRGWKPALDSIPELE
ncbi:PREDICTED: uncharacterized protein LOC104816397 [Tarenaya hassleriana]|uniref:uncharacterized protein LOC104816397 n=1 Tax=Tarenaya hassleriana TaxID=28532 RepID=UPI00053C7FD1|nr:PREDICTED: uncharacterized protein LOC104816397 [Tarenaya hassleriana]